MWGDRGPADIYRGVDAPDRGRLRAQLCPLLDAHRALIGPSRCERSKVPMKTVRGFVSVVVLVRLTTLLVAQAPPSVAVRQVRDARPDRCALTSEVRPPA